MFGYVTASANELTQTQKDRYTAVYCGICRRIRSQSSNLARLTLSYDMAFLALLLMSLYEPQEQGGDRACILHPIRKRPWTDNEYIRYAADMNVALGYYNCLDDWMDDKKVTSKWMAGVLEPEMDRIHRAYPRQCRAISDCITTLARLEAEGCPNPDETANCFGELMAQLLIYRQDLWETTLGRMGFHLGRFIYLTDGAVDYRRDRKKGKYNPFLAMGMEEDWSKWEEYLVLAMAGCTAQYEKLPLVQDKDLLDNILYSGVWVNFRRKQREAMEDTHDR